MTLNKQIQTLAKRLAKTSPDDPQYAEYERLFRTAINIQDFADYLSILGSEVTTLDELQAAYEHPIVIVHNNNMVEIPFSANLYNSLVSLVNNAMEDF